MFVHICIHFNTSILVISYLILFMLCTSVTFRLIVACILQKCDFGLCSLNKMFLKNFLVILIPVVQYLLKKGDLLCQFLKAYSLMSNRGRFQNFKKIIFL